MVDVSRGVLHLLQSAAGFIPTPGHFFFMFLVFFLAITMFTYLGQFLVFLTPSQGLGQILASGQPDAPAILQCCQCT